LDTVQETKPKSHQEQLARLQEQVRALREQLHRAQRLAELGTMTAMVAHEFNNILTPIINYAKLARDNPALVAKAIDHAEAGGQRASHICKAILGIARDETSGPAEVNVAELVRETLSAMGRESQRDGIDVTLLIAEDLSVVTRRVELQHVFLNLLNNARAAVLAKDGPRKIKITAERVASKLSFSISDNGVGITPENLQKIFQPFFTTKKPSDGGSAGHGLGLAICRDIINSLGGTISVESSPAKGTEFTILLPA